MIPEENFVEGDAIFAKRRRDPNKATPDPIRFDHCQSSSRVIISEVKEIEDNLKVKQNGFEMLRANPNFGYVIVLGIGLQLIQQAYRDQRCDVFRADDF